MPRALLSVTDRTGVVELATVLVELGWDVMATDGTAALLAGHGLPVLSTTDWTGTPVLFNGRVKTLHHKVFAALLCRGDRPDHRAEAMANNIVPFALVAGNFQRLDPDRPGLDVLDTIDVGGPAMMRAAAKNHPWVLPLVDPADYPTVVTLLRAGAGAPESVDLIVRRRLAVKAFRTLGQLDLRIAGLLAEGARAG